MAKGSIATAVVRLGRGATPIWTVVAGARDVEFPDRAPTDLDVTDQDSGFNEETIPGLHPASDWQLDLTHVPGSPLAGVLKDLLTRDPVTGRIEEHLLEIAIGGDTRTYMAFLKEYKLMKPVGTVIMARGTWRVLAEVIDAPAGVPVNTVLPAISGIAQEGQTLTGYDGEWTNAPTSYTYVWEQEISSTWTAIAGATAKTLVVPGGATVGRPLRRGVIAINAAGASPIAYSAPTVPVVAA
jgi:hypothetical protein